MACCSYLVTRKLSSCINRLCVKHFWGYVIPSVNSLNERKDLRDCALSGIGRMAILVTIISLLRHLVLSQDQLKTHVKIIMDEMIFFFFLISGELPSRLWFFLRVAVAVTWPSPAIGCSMPRSNNKCGSFLWREVIPAVLTQQKSKGVPVHTAKHIGVDF